MILKCDIDLGLAKHHGLPFQIVDASLPPVMHSSAEDEVIKAALTIRAVAKNEDQASICSFSRPFNLHANKMPSSTVVVTPFCTKCKGALLVWGFSLECNPGTSPELTCKETDWLCGPCCNVILTNVQKIDKVKYGNLIPSVFSLSPCKMT